MSIAEPPQARWAVVHGTYFLDKSHGQPGFIGIRTTRTAHLRRAPR
jgi:hypothetical protein